MTFGKINVLRTARQSRRKNICKITGKTKLFPCALIFGTFHTTKTSTPLGLLPPFTPFNCQLVTIPTAREFAVFIVLPSFCVVAGANFTPIAAERTRKIAGKKNFSTPQMIQHKVLIYSNVNSIFHKRSCCHSLAFFACWTTWWADRRPLYKKNYTHKMCIGVSIDE